MTEKTFEEQTTTVTSEEDMVFILSAHYREKEANMLKIDAELLKLHTENGLFSAENAAAYISKLSTEAKEELSYCLSRLFKSGKVRKLSHTMCRGRYIINKS